MRAISLIVLICSCNLFVLQILMFDPGLGLLLRRVQYAEQSALLIPMNPDSYSVVKWVLFDG